VVEEAVEFGGVVAVEHRGHFGDEAGAGEDLAPREEGAFGVHQPGGDLLDLFWGEGGGDAGGVLAGGVERSGDALDRPTRLSDLRVPALQQLVYPGMALHRAGGTGGDVGGLVGGVALLGEVGGDLIGAFGELLADVGGDTGDAPVPEPAGGAVVAFDGVAQLDGEVGGLEAADHGGGFDPVAEQGGVEGLVAAFGVEHLGHVRDQHVVVGGGVPGPGGPVPGHRPRETGGGRRRRRAAAAAAVGLHRCFEGAHQAVGLGVEDGVHVIGPPDEPQHGGGLVRGDHDLHAGRLGGYEAVAGEGVTEPARPERQFVLLGGDLAGQAEPGGHRSAPAQRGLTPGPVVLQGTPGMVVATSDDSLLVVRHRVDAHRPEPTHRLAFPPPTPGRGLKSCPRVVVCSIRVSFGAYRDAGVERIFVGAGCWSGAWGWS
jgi:hypothetical protein